MAEELGAEKRLPHSEEFGGTEEYVESLLDVVGSHHLLRTLCGGVHILDFFTCEPPLYSRILSAEWRHFFAQHTALEIVDLLIRVDVSKLRDTPVQGHSPEPIHPHSAWGDADLPPASLIDYICLVRKHLLGREPPTSQCSRNRAVKSAQKLARNVTVGMNIKKVHEVALFSAYLDHLAHSINAASTEKHISHLVDFGSGQNYLGRALASEPYNHRIVAIESRQANAERAKEFDVSAKLVQKTKVMRDKKAFRNAPDAPATRAPPLPVVPADLPPPPPHHNAGLRRRADEEELPPVGAGRIQYVEHHIEDGNLQDVIARIPGADSDKNLIVVSLHSCGNLVHHGLRSLTLNPQVKAVAMIGCCYNLLTERLSPATYKLPQLRPTTHNHPRLHTSREANDPQGFPMSRRFCDYADKSSGGQEKGLHLNITGRMMAVQAPANWGPSDSESFFTRHFYRALLQRIFLDRGIVGPPAPDSIGGVSPAGHSSGGTPIVIGGLRKSCYESFVSYVRGALEKLAGAPETGAVFTEKLGDIRDEEILRYEEEYQEGKKNLSVIWSLMAFSAGVIESAIVVDRWLWLTEQDQVRHAWVEPVFDYRFSPRNLVVVGIKK